MLASRFGSTTLADIMADDTMEISSEHGHNMGDEDIDIDIDFTAGHVDEDYILEDATSNVGFGDEFHPQPSPVIGHDDLMIDDGDESYPMPMDGADLMRDDTHNMEDEPLTMSSAETSIPTVLVEEGHFEDAAHLGDGSMNDEVSWEANDEPEPAGDKPNLEDPEAHHISHQKDEDLQEIVDIKEAEAPAIGTPLQDSHPNTPLDRSPKVHAVGEEPRSPPSSISAPEADSHDHGSNHPAEAPNRSPASQEIVSTTSTATAEEATFFSSVPEVVVVYQDSEYSLFSKSEEDDIDTYFLSDISIVGRPLSKCFEAIRDVIHDDLNDEDELCMSAEDLGLDIEELSLMTASITIGQIINLHERLLQNDGVESVRPLCLLLSTRPNFSMRFAKLISGASEGKGLSELVQWDEQSESFDDSAHVTENEHGEGLDGEGYEADEGFEESAEKSENKVPQQQSSDDTLPQDPITEQQPAQEAGNFESLDRSGIAATNGTYESNDSVAQHIATEDVLPLQKTEASGSGEDEDGDLIDYSDVEDQAQPALRKDATSCPTKLETDNKTHNEYEAINEELRRRSISRTAGDNLLQQAADPSVANEGEEHEHEHETNFETENDIEYDENDGEEVDQANLAPEHEDPSADFGEDNGTEFDDHEDEFYIEDGDVNGGEIVDGHDLTAEPTTEGGQPFDDFDFGEDDTQHQDPPESAEQEIQFHDDNATPAADQNAQLSKKAFSTGSSLGLADAHDSESSASEKTLEAHPASIDDLATELNKENEDEIDYDDDEEPDVLQVQESDVKELQALNNGSGKRQRVDDDGVSAGSKEAKRPRS